ncbi:MAG: TlpA family protein disulfide reductase [Actinobacteria bacterium]|nr:TlpA family protein disulfide reductase [Thermoleophilia bacterium]MCB9012020.1 TlpA family protein disulfide reductase [Actinomycetota bacterium]
MTDETVEEPPAGWDRRRITYLVVMLIAVGAISSLLIVGMLNRGADNTIDKAIARGERAEAPDFSLPVLVAAGPVGPVDQEMGLSSLRGNVVVLNFWASWCEPCKQEAPLVESLWTQYRKRGLVVLGINVRNVKTDALKFHSEYGLSFPSVRDGEGKIQGPYGVTGVPETIVVDRRGRIAATVRWPLESGPNFNSLKSVVDTLIAEPAGEVAG